ncbi:MAG: M23 family metallopeptidase [Treponema sp.]|jgi:murein DD-endopeptidase MepM/ murein hydrolase activator NlpD|nr:M23 family metallopeptidase [Treponema sp.]
MKRVCILILGVFVFLPVPAFSEETVHVMQRGDTIYSLARSYGVSPAAILSLNGIEDPRTVKAGQRIRIPSAGTAEKEASGEYRVEKNDTLYSLARRYGVTVAELLDMNGFAPGYVLKAGETIRVPGGAPDKVLAGTTGTTGNGGSGTNAPERPGDPVKWPITGVREVSYITGKLYGVQVTGERQEPVKSLTRGTVVSAGPYRGFGRVAIVQMPGGYLYVYGGCETLSVKEGDKVVSGTELGKLGVDAKSAKPQLFFFVYRSNNPVDPAKAPRA